MWATEPRAASLCCAAGPQCAVCPSQSTTAQLSSQSPAVLLFPALLPRAGEPVDHTTPSPRTQAPPPRATLPPAHPPPPSIGDPIPTRAGACCTLHMHACILLSVVGQRMWLVPCHRLLDPVGFVFPSLFHVATNKYWYEFFLFAQILQDEQLKTQRNFAGSFIFQFQRR